MSTKAQWFRCAMLFLFAFALHQSGVFFFNADPSLGWFLGLMLFLIAFATFLVIRWEGSSLADYGFLVPKRSNRLLTISVFFGVVFAFTVLFLPGALSGFEALPGTPIDWDFLLKIGSILLASVATEMAFRGYVQTEIQDMHGFNVAFVVVSIMFTLYMLPVTQYFAGDVPSLLGSVFLLFAESVFLCFFFKETKTILCPTLFVATVTFLRTFTPLEAAGGDFTIPLAVVTYLVLIPVMQSFVDEVRQHDLRLAEVPILEPE